MTVILLQVTAIVFLNAGIAALFDTMNTKTSRKTPLLMAAACFVVSSVICGLTAPEIFSP